MTSNELGNASANQSFNLWYHPLYTDGIHAEARFPRERYQILLNRLRDSEQFHMFAIREPRQISKDSLLLAHDATYVEEFLEQKLSEKEMRRIGLTPWTPKMIERTLCLTGGALEATIHAVKYGGWNPSRAPRFWFRILHLQRSRNLCDVCNREIGSKTSSNSRP